MQYSFQGRKAETIDQQMSGSSLCVPECNRRVSDVKTFIGKSRFIFVFAGKEPLNDVPERDMIRPGTVAVFSDRAERLQRQIGACHSKNGMMKPDYFIGRNVIGHGSLHLLGQPVRRRGVEPPHAPDGHQPVATPAFPMKLLL